ncbi:MAG: hypothetical protein IKI75_04835 [Lachnospiraceae bacterium]|nr:hypothetical protein [Lachnospiraceae bacterium]
MKKRVFITTILIAAFMLICGCGAGDSIEGKWVLTAEELGDGTKMNAKDLEENGIAETYEISGDKVKYTCDVELLGKPIDIDFVLEDNGDGSYDFKLESGLVFVEGARVKGNTMTYETGEGNDRSKMIFKRQK